MTPVVSDPNELEGFEAADSRYVEQARVRQPAGVVEVEVLQLLEGGHLLNGGVVDVWLAMATHQVEVGEAVRGAGDQLVDQVLVHGDVEREVKLHQIPEM